MMNNFGWDDRSREMQKISSFDALSEDASVRELNPKYLHLEPPIAERMTIIPKSLPRNYYPQAQYAQADNSATLQRNLSQPGDYGGFRHPATPIEPAYNPENRLDNFDHYKERDLSPVGTYDNLIDFQHPKPRSCMYCCIPVNKRSRTICLSVTALILVIIGVLLFLFFPRMPTFKVLGFIDDTKGGIKYKLEDFDKSKPENLHFTMQMVMNITVVNSNYYTLNVNKINLKTYIVANITEINQSVPHPAQTLFDSTVTKWRSVTENTQRNYVGSGYALAQSFRPNVNISFPMPLQIDYRPRKDLGGATNDPTLNELIQLCVSGDKSRKSVIYYEAENEIPALSFLGIKPVTTGYGQIACPFQGSAREQFFQYLKGK